MFRKNKFVLILVSLLISASLWAQAKPPVNPNASKEAKALLEFIYSLSGKYTLAGQHNFPISRDRNSQFAANYIGKTPTVWSQDFGFAKEGDKDSYLARPSIIEEAIRQHQMGSIVTLCWHAVPPTADEPITFQPLPGSDSTALASVQGNLTDQQFEDLFTPGTTIYNQWIAQVDEIAKFLKQLQVAKVPVLWRPYHEMNGDWFWWGGRHEGQYTTERLYRQIFDRMVKHHQLDNLIWMWSVDRPSEVGREFYRYYPGDQYLDIVSLDVYGSDFKQSYYDGLKDLAKGKPLALGEVGGPPSLEVLDQQPDWTFWVIWSGMAKGTPKEQYDSYKNDARILFAEDKSYQQLMHPFRTAAGLPSLEISTPADFTGRWTLNEDESKIESSFGISYKMNIIQIEEQLAIESYSQIEWGDDQVSKKLITGDGSDMLSTFFNAPRVENANWSPERKTLTIQSKVNLNFGGNARELKGTDIWSLERKGRRLIIARVADTFRGTAKSMLVYDKQ